MSCYALRQERSSVKEPLDDLVGLPCHLSLDYIRVCTSPCCALGGDIDATDYTLSSGSNAALARGVLSSVDSMIGFSGYVYNAECELYLVRFRCYSTTLGRWLERDPLHYVDGANLYSYALGQPVTLRDPMGLDVWIESDSKRSGHLSICVGDPGGFYECYSFGVDDSNRWTWEHGITGEVYADTKGDAIYEDYYLITTSELDQMVRQMFHRIRGRQGPYRLNSTCRNFCFEYFDAIERQFGSVRAARPPKRPPPSGGPAKAAKPSSSWSGADSSSHSSNGSLRSTTTTSKSCSP